MLALLTKHGGMIRLSGSDVPSEFRTLVGGGEGAGVRT